MHTFNIIIQFNSFKLTNYNEIYSVDLISKCKMHNMNYKLIKLKLICLKFNIIEFYKFSNSKC
jgi:hypothetical protein